MCSCLATTHTQTQCEDWQHRNICTNWHDQEKKIEEKFKETHWIHGKEKLYQKLVDGIISAKVPGVVYEQFFFTNLRKKFHIKCKQPNQKFLQSM